MTKLAKSSRIKQFGEVFTPKALVDEMINQLEFDWTDPTKTILEPSVGNGNFIEGLLDKLMPGLEAFEPDPILRHKHIFEHMIYAIDIQQDNIDECIKRFGLQHLKHHFVTADALTYNYRFDEYEPLFEWS